MNYVLEGNRVDGRFYIVVQAWSPGDFAVLEQVTE